MTNTYKTLLFACLSVALSSCNSGQIGEDAASAAAISALPVVAVGYGTSYAGKAGWQNLSIALDAPDVLYAEEIEHVPSPAFDPAYAKLPAFADDYWYMGSKGDFNYLMHYPPLGLRKVLKIKKSNYEISDHFPLTSQSKSWRRLNLSPQFNFAVANDFMLNDHFEANPVDDVFQFDLFPGAGLHRQRNVYLDALNDEDGYFIEPEIIVREAEAHDFDRLQILMPEIIVRETGVYDFERLQRDQLRQRYILLDDEPAEPSVPKERN